MREKRLGQERSGMGGTVVLQVPEARVQPLSGQKLLVGSLFEQLPVVEDQDPVCLCGALQAMGDDDEGLACGEMAKPAGKLCLGGRIDIRGRLVEDQDVWATRTSCNTFYP